MFQRAECSGIQTSLKITLFKTGSGLWGEETKDRVRIMTCLRQYFSVSRQTLSLTWPRWLRPQRAPFLGIVAPCWWGVGIHPALWVPELEGTAYDQGQLLFLEEILFIIFDLWSIKEKSSFEFYSQDPRQRAPAYFLVPFLS